MKTRIDDFAVHEPEPAALIGFLKAMEFSTLHRRAASHFGVDDVDAVPPRPIRRNRARSAGDMTPLPSGQRRRFRRKLCRPRRTSARRNAGRRDGPARCCSSRSTTTPMRR